MAKCELLVEAVNDFFYGNGADDRIELLKRALEDLEYPYPPRVRHISDMRKATYNPWDYSEKELKQAEAVIANIRQGFDECRKSLQPGEKPKLEFE